MGLTQISLRLDEGLLARVDGATGDVPRNTWIVRAIEQRLDRDDAGAVVPRPSGRDKGPSRGSGAEPEYPNRPMNRAEAFRAAERERKARGR